MSPTKRTTPDGVQAEAESEALPEGWTSYQRPIGVGGYYGHPSGLGAWRSADGEWSWARLNDGPSCRAPGLSGMAPVDALARISKIAGGAA